MKQLPFILLVVSVLMAFAVGCTGQPTPAADLTPTPQRESASTYADTSSTVNANGVVAPRQQVNLSFGVGGFVEAVEVELGDRMQAGQVLASLDTTQLQRAVAQAELELKSAQARLAHLQAQATPIPEQVLAATAAITNAQTMLSQARTQAGQHSNYDTIDRVALKYAERALADAQREYEKVLNDFRTHDWAPSSPAGTALAEAKDRYDSALAQYNLNVADRAYAVAIANAEAQLAQARLSLYQAQNPIRLEALRLAQIDVERAQQVVEAARSDLERAMLKAPFDGIVSAVEISHNEWAAPGAQGIELLDVSEWRVETKNVGELQIARVKAGQEVRVRVNAFQGETLQGHVLTISPVAVVQQGDTTYTLTIALEPTSLNLQPGMTAQVEIVIP
jgi:HlyD family secretion protein